MIEKYTIRHPYKGGTEIEILSDNLIYTELGTTHSGCQCMNLDNADLIHEKCRQISVLIKEIDELNKKQNDRGKEKSGGTGG